MCLFFQLSHGLGLYGEGGGGVGLFGEGGGGMGLRALPRRRWRNPLPIPAMQPPSWLLPLPRASCEPAGGCLWTGVGLVLLPNRGRQEVRQQAGRLQA